MKVDTMKKVNKLALDNLIIVLVVYEKKLSQISLINELNKKGINSSFFIYDNSKISQHELALEYRILYKHDETNPGVSVAYNHVFKYANENDKLALLMLDQDTNFSLDYIENYIEKYNEHGDMFVYSPIITDAIMSKIYSPSSMSSFVGKALSVNDFKYDEVYSLSGKSVINSGLLIPLKIFNQLGGYNPEIKLDFSDVYFIEKYKEINNKIILIDCKIKHSLSGDEGANYNTEIKRFPYYCNGAVEFTKSLKKSTIWTVFRRTVRLLIKYKKITPLFVFYKYYIKRHKI